MWCLCVRVLWHWIFLSHILKDEFRIKIQASVAIRSSNFPTKSSISIHFQFDLNSTIFPRILLTKTKKLKIKEYCWLRQHRQKFSRRGSQKFLNGKVQDVRRGLPGFFLWKTLDNWNKFPHVRKIYPTLLIPPSSATRLVDLHPI